MKDNLLEHLYNSRKIKAQHHEDSTISMVGWKDGKKYKSRDESAIVALLNVIYKMDGGEFNFNKEKTIE